MGKLHAMGGGFGVKWKVCQYNGELKNIFSCKWATLTRYQGCQIAMWNMCQLKRRNYGTCFTEDYAHLKNMKLHFQKGPKSIFVQIKKTHK